jgi:hypothetical protein
LIETVFWHHASSLEIAVATPIKMVPGEFNVMKPSGRFKGAYTFGDNLAANTISFNHGYFVAFHNASG